MAATYGGAVSATNLAVVDTLASQATGAACSGIGLQGADEAVVGGERIGGTSAAELKYEQGDGVGL